MPTPTYYAGSIRFSGVFHFETEEERDTWCAEHAGFVLEPEQVDPEIRREVETS